MHFGTYLLRLVAAILTLTALCASQQLSEYSKKSRRNGKYPLQIYNMYQNQIKKHPKAMGVWSSWGAWTPCSRSCGGGVTTQMRNCIIKPADPRFIKRQRKRRQHSNLNGCVGLYKRVHMCNIQECTTGTADFRYEQCASFNNRPFKGKMYIWEPFLEAPDQCALNCRPLGMDFYATLNKTVIDGTSCPRPTTSSGKLTPKGTRGVCVDGYCKTVNSYGVVGNLDENQEDCAACLKGSCRKINGIYTRSNLPPGYALVAQIPQGACRILVQQSSHTRNFLALRNANGSFIINGDYKFSASRSVEGAGTRFTYVRQDEVALETLSSPGPVRNAVDIYIVTYQPNQGIKYGYLLPVNDLRPSIAPPLIKRPSPEVNSVESGKVDRSIHLHQQDDPRTVHRQRRPRRRFGWKITGVTACSKTCGGGIQATVVTCMRELTQTPVADRKCAHLERPNTNPVKCNIQDCPPRWDGSWGPCSVTCGDGIQRFLIECRQELSNGQFKVVSDSICSIRPKPLVKTRVCSEMPCDIIDNELPKNPEVKNDVQEWSVGSWSPCSVSCGQGHRSRSVSCPSGQCHPEDRPSHLEYCNIGSCDSSTSASSWMTTEWTKCSEFCGTGTQKRFAVCETNNCDLSQKPETTRACSTDKYCGGQWVTGEWGECGDSCSGFAVQKRQVFCVVKIRGQYHITNEMTCPSQSRPSTEQSCQGTCTNQWFAGEWSPCDGCPNGLQRRQVKCMDMQGKGASNCKEEEKPLATRQCTCQGRLEHHRERLKPIQDEPTDRSCTDKIRNCYLAVQARLCKYAYYTHHCCASCRRVQDYLE